MAIDLLASADPADPIATIAGLRTLGTGSQQASAGNHSTAISSITATGTPNSTTFLRGDGAWAAPVTAAAAPAGTYWKKRSNPLGTEPTGGATGSGFLFANSTFVAVSGTGGGASCSSSTNGVTYTTRTLPTAVKYCGLSFGAGVFVAMGSSWTNNSTATTVAASSPDGVTWTSRTMPASRQWSSTAWNGSIFVAVGCAAANAGTTSAASSTDGLTWTARTMPSTSPWTSVCWDGTKFIAQSTSGGVSAVSTDGITWTAGGTAGSIGWLATDGAGRVVGLLANGTTAYVTTDHAVTWNAGVVVPGGQGPAGVWYLNGLFYLGSNTGLLYYSSDGVFWNPLPFPSFQDGNSGVVYDGTNIHLLTANGGTYYG